MSGVPCPLPSVFLTNGVLLVPRVAFRRSFRLSYALRGRKQAWSTVVSGAKSLAKTGSEVHPKYLGQDGWNFGMCCIFLRQEMTKCYQVL